MANPRQLKRLKEDVNAWNEWRKKNREVEINLRGANLSGQDLSGANLRGADIHSANFSKAILRDADFSGSKAGLQRRWAIALVLCYSLLWLILLCLTIFVLVGIPIRIITEAKIILSEEGLLLGTIAFAVSLVGTIIFGSAVKLITQGESKPKESILVVLIFLAIYTIIFVPSLFIAELQEVIETPKAIEGTVGIVLIWILIASAWYVQKEKKFPRDYWISYLAIALVRIKDTSFRDAYLNDAIFSKAILKGADFRGANISNVVWLDAEFFERVRPGNSYLKYPQVRQLVRTGSAQNQQPFKNKNLSGINLKSATLNDTNFAGADLSNANLQEAELSRANFLETKLEGAILTGASIEDWNINRKTNLNNIVCDYVYLKEGKQDRSPSDPNRNFQTGEFAQRFQDTFETIDLMFRDGINWTAFACSINNTQVLNEDTPLAIQSIEDRGDGAILIKVKVPENTEKTKKDNIKRDFWEEYEFARIPLQEQYDARLSDKDKVIEQQNQHINNLFYLIYQSQEKLPQLMAEAKKVNNFYGSVGSVDNEGEQTNISGNVQGSQIGIQYMSEQKQILLELEAHIKKILEQFEQNNPDATDEEKIIYLNDNTTPSFKRRVIGALQAAGETAIEEFLDNSYVNIGKATIKAWLKPE